MAAAQGLDSFLSRGSDAGGSAAPTPAPSTSSAEPVDNSSASTAQAEASGEGDSSEPQDFDANDPAQRTPHQRAGLRKALEAERKKRQEYERKLAQFEGQLSVYQQQSQPKQQQQQPVDEDDQFYSAPPKYVNGVVDKKVSEINKTVEAVRLELSEDMVRGQHQDYDDVISSFHEAAQNDPTLLARFQAQVATDPRARRNPARFAYDYAKTYREVSTVGSLDELRAKIEADLRPKLEAELRKKGVLAAAEQASTSSAGARGSGVTSPVTSGDIPIGEILRGR